MPNLSKVIGDEIRRLARKEIRLQVGETQKSLREARRQISALRKQVQQQERQIKKLTKQAGRAASATDSEGDGEPLPRFSAGWVSKHREKLGLSAADYGTLVGVSALTIYNWEKGASTPRQQPLRRWGKVRQLGKREALRLLENLEAE